MLTLESKQTEVSGYNSQVNGLGFSGLFGLFFNSLVLGFYGVCFGGGGVCFSLGFVFVVANLPFYSVTSCKNK